ncbi:MAG: hypothetical protein Fur0040_12470 [Sideroxydans sp.]
MIEAIEWTGCIIGLCGAMLLAMNTRYSAWGWVLFLLSNAAWILFGLMTHATGLVVMQLGFTITSLMGVWKWLVVPRMALKSIHKNGG